MGRSHTDPGHRGQHPGQRAGVSGRVLGATTPEHDQLLPHVSRRRRPARVRPRHALRHGRRTLR